MNQYEIISKIKEDCMTEAGIHDIQFMANHVVVKRKSMSINPRIVVKYYDPNNPDLMIDGDGGITGCKYKTF